MGTLLSLGIKLKVWFKMGNTSFVLEIFQGSVYWHKTFRLKLKNTRVFCRRPPRWEEQRGDSNNTGVQVVGAALGHSEVLRASQTLAAECLFSLNFEHEMFKTIWKNRSTPLGPFALSHFAPLFCHLLLSILEETEKESLEASGWNT